MLWKIIVLILYAHYLHGLVFISNRSLLDCAKEVIKYINQTVSLFASCIMLFTLFFFSFLFLSERDSERYWSRSVKVDPDDDYYCLVLRQKSHLIWTIRPTVRRWKINEMLVWLLNWNPSLRLQTSKWTPDTTRKLNPDRERFSRSPRSCRPCVFFFFSCS